MASAQALRNQLLLIRAGLADPERILDSLADGADINAQSRKGRTALSRAILAPIVDARVVELLLQHGADRSIPDLAGLTPLDHARRRLARYEGKPRRPPRRSPCLTAGGEVILNEAEVEFLDSLHDEHPAIADEIEATYLRERRKAAERIIDDRGNLEKIVELLERPARP